MNTLEPKASAIPPSALNAGHGKAPVTGDVSAQPKLRRWAWVIVIGLIILLAVGAVPRWFHRQSLDKETIELATPSVQVIHAAPGKASASLMLPAEVRPFVEAPIFARASGFVKHWYVDIGARVEANQLLADIDTPELDQQLSGAKAELEQANAAQSLAKITADRWADLLKTASVAEQENAEKQADLKLKIAAVDTAAANVHRLDDLESYTHVTAPFAGILTAPDIDVRDLIGSGKELFRLADITKLRVFVRVPQSATPGIVNGVDAELIVPELPAHKFAAKVVRTSGSIDASSRTLLAELEVDNSKGEILSGSYANVSFPDMKQDPSLVLPANTLLFRAEGLQVGVVGQDGTVELRSITMGRDFGKTVEVVAGITANDRIIVNPVDSLTSGSKVHATDAPAEIAAK